MDSEELLRLADGCEKAPGPNREMDAKIFKAMGAPVPFEIFGKLVALTFDEAEQCYFAPIGDMRVRYRPPAYTLSLDAAMMLAPEGCVSINQEQQKLPDGSIRCWANVDAWPASQKRCATPALALCAAALRARAAQDASA